MTRWQHTKDSDEMANFLRLDRMVKGVYKALIAYLNGCQQPWRIVQARIDFTALDQPTYSQIYTDGILNFADLTLLGDCEKLLTAYNTYTYSDDAIATVGIDIDRNEPLGSFGHDIDYLPRIDRFGSQSQI